jgi:hypothetical protein
LTFHKKYVIILKKGFFGSKAPRTKMGHPRPLQMLPVKGVFLFNMGKDEDEDEKHRARVVEGTPLTYLSHLHTPLTHPLRYLTHFSTILPSNPHTHPIRMPSPNTSAPYMV